MKLYSTKNKKNLFSLKEAVMKGLPADNGLFMPSSIPNLPQSFLSNLSKFSFQEIGIEVCKTLFQDAIPDRKIKDIVERSINFPAPLVQLDEKKYILELFHGPSLAFKDFGARFMAQLMSYFDQEEKEELVILVATSGDTGGAVASGFYKTPGIKIVILYPSGKVSHLQEKQLTTLGHNISALEVDGTFDDCQAMVKNAFLDSELNAKIRLSSANSINIARLIPQTFYYFEAFKQLSTDTDKVAFCVPSGNFGNLTAGVLAKRMGLNIHQFIAATNINDVVPKYLETGIFTPRPSSKTISNAMDVGNPSNFARLEDIYGFTWNNLKEEIKGYSFTDEETREGMREVFKKYNYIIDPHGAVGYLAIRDYQRFERNVKGVILETAHPSKFIDEVENTLLTKVEIPKRLADLAGKKGSATGIKPVYADLKSWLIENHCQK